MKMTLRLKIIGGFMVAIIAALAIGFFSRHALADFTETSEASVRASQEEIKEIGAIESRYQSVLTYGAGMVSSANPEMASMSRSRYTTATADVTNKLVSFGQRPLSPEARSLHEKALESLSWSNKLANNYMGASFPVPKPDVQVPGLDELMANLSVGEARSQQLLSELGALRDQVWADAASARETLKADADAALRQVTVVTLVVSAALAVFAVWLSYVLVKRLRATAKVLDRVADGDLTARCDAGGGDEVGQMGRSLNASLSTIHDVMRQIDDDADRLATLARDQQVGGSAADSTVVMAASAGRGEELAEMAENLNTMMTLFVIRRDPVAADAPTSGDPAAAR